MAIQTGNIPIKGDLNKMSFYKSKDGTMVRMKSVISKEQMKGKNFEITNRNNQEFGLAGRAGKTLRYAINQVIGLAKDGRLPSRLTTLMLKIAKTDTTSVHGERNVAMGQLEMLLGFDFNNASPLPLNFKADFTTVIDRASGKVTLDIPAYEPSNALLVPEGATHFQIVAAASEVDFPNDAHITESFLSTVQPVTAATSVAEAILLQLTVNSTLPIFLFLGVHYFLEVNGTKYPIRNSNANSMAIIQLEAAI